MGLLCGLTGAPAKDDRFCRVLLCCTLLAGRRSTPQHTHMSHLTQGQACGCSRLLSYVGELHHPCPPRRAPSLDVFCSAARVRVSVCVLVCACCCAMSVCPLEVPSFCVGRSCRPVKPTQPAARSCFVLLEGWTTHSVGNSFLPSLLLSSFLV